jgi:mRNA-degrading endonuclease YafQ of YafQ-DinJ toxin-antitoxin module
MIKVLIKSLSKVLETLKSEPFYPSLKTHKVDIPDQKSVYSSRITGDWRLIWEFDDEDNMVILCLKLGTHGGANQVYTTKSN